MKRFTKIMLIAAVICFILGTGITLAAVAIGGGPDVISIGSILSESTEFAL